GAVVASKIPEVANCLAHAPVLSWLVKKAGGVSTRRSVPSFAPLSLQEWISGRGKVNPGGPRVILWADTFNNYFHTQVGVAAVEALEAAGYQVTIPRGHLCCGRPLYDYGMLNGARRYLRRVLDALHDEIRAGTPVVGIEPSCVAVFKDELLKLFPDDEDALRLSRQTFHFAGFLERERTELPHLTGKALLHGHCHHRATGGIGSEKKLLERI